MHNTPHLVVSISGHGFGHVSQTAPVLNALHQRMPQLRFTVRSAVPAGHLRSRIHAPFTHLPGDNDFGLMMSSAMDVRVDESRAAYRTLHSDWDARVAGEARLLREIGTDMVLSNAAYLPLAGAQRANIPDAAMCSINWADIYRHYCGDDDIARQIHGCYTNAGAFLRVTPGMAMTDLPNLIPVAPIAAVGTNRRAEIISRLKLSPDVKLALVSMGGIANRSPVEQWPRLDGVRWLVQQGWQSRHPDAIAHDTLQMSFNDLLASSDVFICKPGYGSFVEAACSGVPVLYVNRPDWPESPALIAWLNRYGVCRAVSRDALERGDIADELEELWNAARPEPVIPQGIEQAADWLEMRIGL
ncbi:MAG: hypothetical protein NUV63_00690 [Gallionella sp.]|nr:hypothetical protein [Gallionella sp.]